MSYNYDMESHFRMLASQSQDAERANRDAGPIGRIYLNATPDTPGSIRSEALSRRFLRWMRSRARRAVSGDRY